MPRLARPFARMFTSSPFTVLLSGALLACGGAAGNGVTPDGDAATTPSNTDGGSGPVPPTADAAAQAGGDAAVTPVVTPANLIIEPDQGMTPIYDFISSAKTSIDMTMYELTDPTVTNLLIAAAKNGVAVRVILDQNLEKSNNQTAFTALAASTVQVHWALATYSATHQKTITIDGATSAVMTVNFTPQYYKTSRDFALIVTSPADVQAIETTFAADFAGTGVVPPNGDDLVWSPTNSQSSLLNILSSAKTSLAIENEEMSDNSIVSAIAAAAKRGVLVEVIMTASSSWTANLTTLKTAGVKVVTYSSKAPLYIHAKAIVADYGTATASVFIGSENFSAASLGYNRELGIIVTKDEAVMASINAALAKDFAGGTAF